MFSLGVTSAPWRTQLSYPLIGPFDESFLVVWFPTDTFKSVKNMEKYYQACEIPPILIQCVEHKGRPFFIQPVEHYSLSYLVCGALTQASSPAPLML